MNARVWGKLAAFGLLLSGVLATSVWANDCTAFRVTDNRPCTLEKLVPCDPNGFVLNSAGKKVGCSPSRTLKTIHSDDFDCKTATPPDPRMLSTCGHDFYEEEDEFGLIEIKVRHRPRTTWYNCILLANLAGQTTCQKTALTFTMDAPIFVARPCP